MQWLLIQPELLPITYSQLPTTCQQELIYLPMGAQSLMQAVAFSWCLQQVFIITECKKSYKQKLYACYVRSSFKTYVCGACRSS